jgi:hypothetical protein
LFATFEIIFVGVVWDWLSYFFMKTIFVRKSDLDINTVFFKAVVVLMIGAVLVFIWNSQALEKSGKNAKNNRQLNSQNNNQLDNNFDNNHNDNPNNNPAHSQFNSTQSPVELQKILLKRSQQYLIAIERNRSLSPESKAQLILQAKKLINANLKKLSNPAIIQQNSSQLANSQINTTFFANALNKIKTNTNTHNNNSKHQNKKIITSSTITSNNTLRALEFLREHALNKIKIYTPTVHEVMLRVAISDNFKFVRPNNKSLRRNSNLFDNLFTIGAIGCSNIISSQTQQQNLKYFAQLLAKNIKSIDAPEIQLANHNEKNSHNYNITKIAILIAETIVLRN